MPWQQLKLRLPAAQTEQVEDLLLLLGAESISYLDAQDQPLFQLEPGATPLWDANLLCALFPQKSDTDQVIAHLQSFYNERLPDVDLVWELEILQDQVWETVWASRYKPLQFGERLWICPSWCEPPEPDAVNIVLDPGLAFGTGSHPTTAMCLEWLTRNSIVNKTVIDYGCGSGILAIAASLLGAGRVYGFDHDPQALIATRQNRIKNHIEEQQLFAALPEHAGDIRADVLVANILAEPLKKLAPRFAQYLPVGGQILLSGLLERQIPEIKRCYRPFFNMDEVITRDEWASIAGIRI